MTELIQKAIDKIDKEAEAINAPAVTVVASHIIDVYLKSDENAQKALDEEKTLKKCWDDVKSNARKQASGGCAMVSDDAFLNGSRIITALLNPPVPTKR